VNAPSIYCLHVDDRDRLRGRLDQLRDHVDLFAVGMDLHMEQPDTVAIIRDQGLRAYAHFLYYDIQEVVLQATLSLIERGYSALDIHALCGYETIEATCRAIRGKSADVLTVACALLPSQIKLPWWPRPATLAEAEGFAAEKAAEALAAGVNGVLSPREVAGSVANVVPQDKSLLVYADPESLGGWPADWGPFYDWHADRTWEQDEGIRLIQSRRSRS